MKNNPFTSETYNTTWLKYTNKRELKINGIDGVSFAKSSFPNLYYNIGKNLTKGISYTLDENHNSIKLGNKALLVHDVPSYFKTDLKESVDGVKIHKVKQYEGFLADLKDHVTIESYIKTKFSPKSQYKYRRNIKRLESCFNIEYKIHYGAIEKEHYNFVFETFNRLLKKRYSEKEEEYDQLKHWDFYKELIYTMILNKKASLFVIYEEGRPISIMLNFHSDTVVFDAIPVFDTDFSKFTLGYITIIKVLEWCIESKVDFFDFSKGHYDYKERWGTTKYNFDYHIIYNPQSIISTTLGFILKKFFSIKQYLREKEFNKRYQEVLYILKGGEKKQQKKVAIISKKEKCIETIDISELDEIAPSYPLIRKSVNEFLFESKNHINEIKTFKVPDEHKEKDMYAIVGKDTCHEITLK